LSLANKNDTSKLDSSLKQLERLMIKRGRGGMSFLERKRKVLNQNPPSLNLINLKGTREYVCHGRRRIWEGLEKRKRERAWMIERRRRKFLPTT
jgi:hypothetical protein